MNKPQIKNYQKQCWKTYKSKTSIPSEYKYLYGNPVKVHVPVDTTCGGLMIIGAYPTAHFNTIGSVRDVPISDHLYPFSSEKYFDGSSIREVDSGREIEELFLKPLQIDRSQTWITDLVKVFLFKPGHAEKYKQLGFKGTLVFRKEFKSLAKNSISYINNEIEICNPKIILSLGTEVNSVLLNKSDSAATAIISSGQKQSYLLNGNEFTFFACPHPGILMRGGAISNNWKAVLAQTLKHVKKIL